MDILQNLISKIRVGVYTDHPEPFMGPVISEGAAQKLLAAQSALEKQGGVPLVRLKRLSESVPLLSPGLCDVTALKTRPDEEVLGPFLQVIRVPNFEAALKEANATEYGLSAGLVSESVSEYESFWNAVRAGVINWNTPLTGASSQAPFGGVGLSGNHRPSAYLAADYCAYPVASLEVPEPQGN